MPELLPWRCAIDGAGFENFSRNRLKSGHQQHGRNGHALPNMCEKNAVNGGTLAGKDIALQRRPTEHFAQRRQRAIIDFIKDQADGKHAQRSRKEKRSAYKRSHTKLSVQGQRQRHGQYKHADNQHDAVAQIKQQRFAKLDIAERFGKIGDAVKIIVFGKTVPIEQRIIYPHKKRCNKKDKIQQKTRERVCEISQIFFSAKPLPCRRIDSRRHSFASQERSWGDPGRSASRGRRFSCL